MVHAKRDHEEYVLAREHMAASGHGTLERPFKRELL
jgi:hypothetical protein